MRRGFRSEDSRDLSEAPQVGSDQVEMRTQLSGPWPLHQGMDGNTLNRSMATLPSGLAVTPGIWEVGRAESASKGWGRDPRSDNTYLRRLGRLF